MYGTFYTQTVYTASLAICLALGLALATWTGLAFRQAAAVRYRPRHRRPAFGRAAFVTPAPAESTELQVWVPNLPVPIRHRRPRLHLVESTRPPIEFPAIDSALEVFRRNMDSVIAALA